MFDEENIQKMIDLVNTEGWSIFKDIVRIKIMEATAKLVKTDNANEKFDYSGRIKAFNYILDTIEREIAEYTASKQTEKTEEIQ